MFWKVILPPLRIHVWGGYGSQLYALYLALSLSNRFPKRNIHIIAHSSGVTERKLEIDRYGLFKTIQRNDFRFYAPDTSNTEYKGSGSTSNVKSLLKRIILFTGFLATCNNEREFKRLRPWVLSIRGHYTHLAFEPKVLEILYRLISNTKSSERMPFQTIGLQYRLGDLMTLASKAPVPASLIAGKIREIENFERIGVTLFSDSTEVAEERMLHELDGSTSLLIAKMEPDETIVTLANTFVFIGTTSKISVWAAIFRAVITQLENTYLPEQFRPEIELHAISDGIDFY